MRKTIAVGYLFFCLFFFVRMVGLSYADSAEVLPKGIFRTNIETNLYFPVEKRFDPDGHTEDVSHDFNSTLDSNIFPALSPLDNIMGGPGSAIIGTSIVSFKYNFTDLMIGLQYGVTDRLTVGVKVPYWWQKTDVNETRLNTADATVGKNPLYGTPGDPFGGAPIIPLGVGGVPLSTDDVQSLIDGGLYINGKLAIPGFKYKRIKTWSDSGLSDIEAGGRYQYLKNDNWRLAFTGAVRFPTGKVDSPDNLVDLGFGPGVYAILFRLNNDYTGIKNLVLNATIKYDLTLSDKQKKRVPSDANNPIAPVSNEEDVSRNIGDIMEFEGSGSYQFSEGWNLELRYKYGSKTRDDVSGSKNLNYKSLEDETDWTYNLFSTSISYSTIPLFKAKKFPLPVTASVSYENVFAGSNNFLKQQFFSLKLAAFF